LALLASVAHSQTLFLANYDAGTIDRYIVSGGQIISSTTSLITELVVPTCLAVSGNNLFVVMSGSGGSDNSLTIGEYTVAGGTVTAMNPSLIPGLDYLSTGLAVSGKCLFVANGPTVALYQLSGTPPTATASLINPSVIPPAQGLPLAYQLAVAGNSLFVLDLTNNYVSEYSLSGTPPVASLINQIPGTPSFEPQGLAVAGNDLFVEDVTYNLNSYNNIAEYSFLGATLNSVNSSLISLGSSGHYPDDIGFAAAPLPFSLGTYSRTEGPAGGKDSVVLAAPSSMAAWTATVNPDPMYPNNPWLSLVANGGATLNPDGSLSGMGSANVIFSFPQNTGGTRTETITIAGLTLTVTQAGLTYQQVSTVFQLFDPCCKAHAQGDSVCRTVPPQRRNGPRPSQGEAGQAQVVGFAPAQHSKYIVTMKIYSQEQSTLRQELQETKRKCPLPDLMRHLRMGEYIQRICSSPFRVDLNPSFSIYQNANGDYRWKDFGTGDDGDQISFLARHLNIDERQNFTELVAIFTAIASELDIDNDGSEPSEVPLAVKQPRPFPDRTPFNSGTGEQIQKLAAVRGISVAGLQWAQSRGVLIFGIWHEQEVYGVTDTARMARSSLMITTT
jgi:hypothetical protein